jgi:enoyl-CoA hydratase/carnithine racemase
VTDQTILLDRVRAAAVITLNRPDKHNAMDAGTQQRLLDVSRA